MKTGDRKASVVAMSRDVSVSLEFDHTIYIIWSRGSWNGMVSECGSSRRRVQRAVWAECLIRRWTRHSGSLLVQAFTSIPSAFFPPPPPRFFPPSPSVCWAQSLSLSGKETKTGVPFAAVVESVHVKDPTAVGKRCLCNSL